MLPFKTVSQFRLLVLSRRFLPIIASLTLTFFAAIPAISQSRYASAAEKDRAPNIVILLADDLGYGDLGCYGNDWIETPNIDRLAEEGVRLTDFYVDAPVCSPTRAAIMTGRLPQRNGLTNVIETHDHSMHLKADERLIPEVLQKAGYQTVLLGKWHLGEGEGFRPHERGFDQFFGGLLGGMDFFSHDFTDGRHDLWRESKSIHRDGVYITHLMASEAKEFLSRTHLQPFLLMLSFHAVHTAMSPQAHGTIQSPEKWIQLYTMIDKDRDAKSIRYAACVSAMDEAIGEVLKSLEEAKLATNTFVFFTSDNGPEPKAGGTGQPFRGTKHTLWEGGLRVPGIARWPGRIPAGGVRKQPAITHDLFPTILEIAGIEKPDDLFLDGQSLLSMLISDSPLVPRDLIWSYVRDSLKTREKAVRRGEWKWLNAELYNLESDPGETHNLRSEYPYKAKELEAAWIQWVAQFPEEIHRWNGRLPNRGRFAIKDR